MVSCSKHLGVRSFALQVSHSQVIMFLYISTKQMSLTILTRKTRSPGTTFTL